MIDNEAQKAARKQILDLVADYYDKFLKDY